MRSELIKTFSFSPLFRHCSISPFIFQVRYAGHSHFHNIKFRKERQDSYRMNLFNKLTKAIISAVQEGSMQHLK